MSTPQLVAHRGYAASYPENTELSLAKAIEHGACFVECDIQLSSDGVPVLFHDAAMERTTGLKHNLLTCPYETLKKTEACEPARFGDRFVGKGVVIPHLSVLADLLKKAPRVSAFVELKDESLQKHGLETMLNAVLSVLQPVLKQCCMIAYDAEVIRAVKKRNRSRSGWILKSWSEASHQEAKALSPDFLICNHTKIPSDLTPLWAGPWQWCFYEITDPDLALLLHSRGAGLIETMDIEKMLSDPRLRTGGCF